MSETNALAVLPISVVFAQCMENRLTALPLKLPQPNRSLGILRRTGRARPQAAERFALHLTKAFENLKHLIKRHQNAVVWGR